MICIQRHKSFDTHGDAMISIPTSLHRCLLQYVLFLRPYTKNFDEEKHNLDECKVFLNMFSKPLKSGYVSESIRSAWKKSGMEKKFSNVSMVRKSISTLYHQKHPNMTGLVADQLTHQLSTSEMYYVNTVQAPHQSAATVQHIRQNLFGCAPPTPEANINSTVCEKCKKTQAKVTNEMSTQTETHEDFTLKEETPIAKHKRRAFTPEDSKALLGIPLVIEMMKCKLFNSVQMREFLENSQIPEHKRLLDNYTFKQIRDKVRTSYRF